MAALDPDRILPLAQRIVTQCLRDRRTFALLIMDNLANGGMPSGIVEDVAVRRDLQGRGIGKAMMAFAMSECKRSGCYKMMLSSNEIRTDAHKFYESLGFVRHGYGFRVELD